MLHYMLLTAAGVYGNDLYWSVLCSRVGLVILGLPESAMSWIYRDLPATLN